MKYFTFGLLLFLGFGVMGQVVESNDDENNGKSLNFDFGCAVEVDLKIYSANSATPVNDSEEFITGARGIANEDDLIKVEFLKISDVPSGVVTLKFELKNSLDTSYDIWNESFGVFLGTVSTVDNTLTILKDASELPFTVLLQTPSESYTYRDIAVSMDYDGIVDEARATVYEETNSVAIVIESLDDNISPHPWTPTNPYIGSNSFISNISDALGCTKNSTYT